ncbi:MAG: rhodanese-like domain-containing protein [Thermoleophilia bacterium]
MGVLDLFRRSRSIDVAEAARMLAAGEIVLVDVREAAEWKAGRARGAKHAPLSGLGRRLDALTAPGKPVAFMCRSGHRSALACRTARRHGIDAINVRGGLAAWQQAGLPVTRR